MQFRSYFLIIFAFLILFCVFPFLLILINIHYALPILNSIYAKISGIIVGIFGIAVILHCAKLLSDNMIILQSENVQNENIDVPTGNLIVRGLFRYVRNPMYLGDFAVILAEFLIFGYLLLLIYLILVIIFVNFEVIYREEKVLEKKYGENYLNYKNRIPRWIPRLTSLKKDQ